MKSLVLQGPGDLQWKSVPIPAADKDRALVRVRRCCVAESDLRSWASGTPSGSHPVRLGHELCVEVISAPGSDLRPGDLCAVNPYNGCRNCTACRSGNARYCREQQVLGVHCDGGFAPFLAISPQKLFRSRRLSADDIALTDFLVSGAHAAECAGIRPGEPTVIFGLNQLGRATALFAANAGAHVAFVEPQSPRFLSGCAQLKLGQGFHPGSHLVGELRKHFGETPTLIIDATGDAASTKEAFRLAADRSRIAFLGSFPGQEVFHYPDFNHRQLTQFVRRADIDRTFARVIRLLESREIDTGTLITHRWSFAQTAEKLPEFARQPGLVKALIDFDGAG